jgi:hypothetical protein
MTIYYDVKEKIFFRRDRFNRLEGDDVFTIIKIKKSVSFKSENLLN